MIITGKLISCKREVKEFKGEKTKNNLWITLKDVDFDAKQKAEIEAAFAEVGKKMTPGWVKKFEGYVNLKTEFKLPAEDLESKRYESVEDLIQEGFPYIGADVKVSVNIKEGAVYPNAIKFITEGKAFNPFAEFENDEED